MTLGADALRDAQELAAKNLLDEAYAKYESMLYDKIGSRLKILVELALLSLRMQKFGAAHKYSCLAIESGKDTGQMRAVAALSALRLEEYASTSIYHALRARTIKPNYPQYEIILAFALAKLGQNDQGRRSAIEALETSENAAQGILKSAHLEMLIQTCSLLSLASERARAEKLLAKVRAAAVA